MKIAIEGHFTKGKEVIQILESLGGKTIFAGLGFDERYYYYINPNSIIESSLITIKTKNEFKLYTLEEFEKEFPFKIGDIVALRGINKPHKIIALELYVNKLCYKLDNGFHFSPRALTIYGEMKEERNITLTLDKAKEWYKKGGDLKQVALRAFTEKELTKVDLPKTWEEFCNNHPQKKEEYYIDNCSNIAKPSGSDYDRDVKTDKNICPSRKSAEAHLAMIQLEQLRDCWRQGWKPTAHNIKYCIVHYSTEYSVMNFCFISFLSFPIEEMAEEFLKCFRDLIEKAGDLI